MNYLILLLYRLAVLNKDMTCPLIL